MRITLVPFLLACAIAEAHAQTTQSLIAGRVSDSETGLPLGGSRVCYEQAATNTRGSVVATAEGFYAIPLLPPGQYALRAAAQSKPGSLDPCVPLLAPGRSASTAGSLATALYQPQEIHELRLPVAGRLDLNFDLRPTSSLWQKGLSRSYFFPESETVLTFYGPDVDTSRYGTFTANVGNRGALQATISNVIEPEQLRGLPFSGRDVYTMLVTQPGVASDAATGRGLGLSASGQRPSASNFMLDGVENNNSLVTGPLTALAPEAVQDYRVSTSNFSAEYGRTAGYLANAITRSGGNAWHGIGYFNFKNDALNANEFERNRHGLERVPLKESQLGYHVGGPLKRDRLFFSSAFEYLRNRSLQEERKVKFPTQELFTIGVQGVSADLLERFPAPVAGDGRRFTVNATVTPPSSLNRFLALERFDFNAPNGRDRLMARLAFSRLERPDFIWSPYEDFSSALTQPGVNLALNYVSQWSPTLVNELRFGFNRDNLGWERAHPEIPALVISETFLETGDLPEDRTRPTLLPGSPAFAEYKNVAKSWELNDNLTWMRGPHLIKAGGGLLLRRIDGFLTSGRDGQITFGNIFTFANDGEFFPGIDPPTIFRASLARDARGQATFQLPAYGSEYRYNQYYFFAQDTYRVARRLTFNFGGRYEHFGAPSNVGEIKDPLLTLSSGGNILERIAGASLVTPASGDQPIHAADNNDFAVRFGFSYALERDTKTLLRGAYGVFYDRPFDNLWQNVRNNRFVLPTGFDYNAAAGGNQGYLAPIGNVLPAYSSEPFTQDFPKITFFDPGLRTGYAQHYFFGVQRELTTSWSVEVNHVGALGRHLITTDAVNRQQTTGSSVAAGRPNTTYNSDFLYRAGQGVSNYNALTALTNYRSRRGFLQLAYTWGHTIDNQSEPLAGDFFNLFFVSATAGGGGSLNRAAFSEQFNSLGDRANADFDQRHNLVVLSDWEVPALFGSSKGAVVFRNWRFAQIAALRTGFPYSVISRAGVIPGSGVIANGRADLLNAGAAAVDQTAPELGGRVLLNAAAFTPAPDGRVGTSGRNAFRGPGLFNVDVSVSRGFRPGWLGETGRMTFRADVFNILNHANLNNPDAFLGSSTFGLARFGRRGTDTGFPALQPFNETARQFQLILRLEF
jgi:hypothetical protein